MIWRQRTKYVNGLPNLVRTLLGIQHEELGYNYRMNGVVTREGDGRGKMNAYYIAGGVKGKGRQATGCRNGHLPERTVPTER